MCVAGDEPQHPLLEGGGLDRLGEVVIGAGTTSSLRGQRELDDDGSGPDATPFALRLALRLEGLGDVHRLIPASG